MDGIKPRTTPSPRDGTALTKHLWTALAILVGLVPLATTAGPLVLEESARITSPDPAFDGFGHSIAIDGDDMLVTGYIGNVPENEWAAFLFRRQSDGSWRFERKLLSENQPFCCGGVNMVAGMNEGRAAIVAEGGLHFFERTGSTWNEVVPSAPPIPGTDVEIQGGTILVDDNRGCTWGATAFRKNASGQYAEVGHVTGGFKDQCLPGSDVDISGTTLIVGNGNESALPEASLAGIWEGPLGASTGTFLGNPEDPDESFGFPLAIDDGTALIAGGVFSGKRRSIVYVYRRDSSAWQLSTRIAPPEQLMIGSMRSVDHLADKAYVSYPGDSLRGPQAGSVAVFRRNTNGSYTQVARLVTSDADAHFSMLLGRKLKVSGRFVATTARITDRNAVYVFELPANLSQPALVQDDFQDGNAANWQPTAGSNFSVVATSRSRVYRQSSPTGGSSFLNDTDWTNQSIQADVRPVAIASGSWFGLVARRADANNFYYLRLGTNNAVQIRRRLNGVYMTLASAPLPVAPNRNYRLRLEAVGTWLRGYVAGRLFVQAHDASLTSGRAGIAMSGVRGDIDNVVVSPNHAITLFADNFTRGFPNTPSMIEPWGPIVGTWSFPLDGSQVFAQSSTAGDARATTGVSTGDQIVQARVKPTAIGAGGDPWFGLMVRRRDDSNYYFVTARSSNVIQLRRRINGVPQVLDSAPFTFNLNTWHTLRLEAVGNLLRGYVNGVPLLEATDNTFATGKYGLVTSRTAANFDDFRAVQP